MSDEMRELLDMERGIRETMRLGLFVSGQVRHYLKNLDYIRSMSPIPDDDSTQAFRASFPPGPANTTPANMADLLSRMDPAKLRDAMEQINEKETENDK
jgi:hypothetical protein